MPEGNFDTLIVAYLDSIIYMANQIRNGAIGTLDADVKEYMYSNLSNIDDALDTVYDVQQKGL